MCVSETWLPVIEPVNESPFAKSSENVVAVRVSVTVPVMRETLFQIAHDWTFALPVIAVPVMLGSKQTIGALSSDGGGASGCAGSVRGLGEQEAIAAASRRWRTANAS